jgi:Tfp pilus assembly protein PilF/TolB-like protein
VNAPSNQQVEDALERILASPGFRSAERMSGFLRFVVLHTLSGDQAPLKEYLIADRVFGRGESFDPRTDTIVRVEARRLRAKLEKYYLDEGRDDAVVIQLPPRGYSPIFRMVSSPPASAPPAPRRQRLAWAISAAIALLCTGGAMAWLFWARSQGVHFTHSVAVVPCLSVGTNPDDEVLARGLSNDIVSLLRNVPELRVVGHVPPVPGEPGIGNARAIGRRFGVDAVLECTLRAEGPQQRVTALLRSASDGLPVWTSQFERDFDGPRSATELTRSIVSGLKIALPASVDARIRPMTTSGVGSERYAFGRHYWSRAIGTLQREDLAMGIRFMELAIEADSGSARAYAGLADALGIFMGSGWDPDVGQTYERTKWAIRKAFDLDPNLAESQMAMGALYASERNWAACDHHFLKAIALKRSLAPAYQAYAVLCLFPQQRTVEAVARLRQAIGIESARAETYVFLGEVLLQMGQVEEAERELNKAIVLESGYVTARMTLARVHLKTGKLLDAKRELQKAESAAGTHPFFHGLLGYTHARLGNHAEATKALQLLQTHQPGLAEVEIAGIHSGLGDAAAALDWLEKARSRSQTGIAHIVDDVRFQNLHSNPQFVALLKQIEAPAE